MSIKSRIGLLVLVLSLTAIPVVVLAQEVTPVVTPAPEVTPEPTSQPPIVVDQPPSDVAPPFEAPALADAVQAFTAALVAIFAAAIASPITAPLVSLIKRIPIKFVQDTDANVWNIVVAVVLSVVVWLGQLLGISGQIDTSFKLIYALLPFISGIGANFLANAAVYAVGKKNNMPVLGYSRSAELPVEHVGVG